MSRVMTATEIQVLHRTGQWCAGRRVGEVAAYDVPILPDYQVAGHPSVDRCYLLLDQGIQLTRTATFDGPEHFPPESIAFFEALPCFLD
jgi:hypothetical protein